MSAFDALVCRSDFLLKLFLSFSYSSFLLPVPCVLVLIAAGLSLKTRNQQQPTSTYPLNTFFKPMLLVLATEIGSRSKANALKVAFTTLCGLAEPNDLANTLSTPALSNTARMLPPAITP